mgnify:CR=1 FL=1
MALAEPEADLLAVEVVVGSHFPPRSKGRPYRVMVRDAALVGVQASLALNKDVRVILDYTGQLASREKLHGVGLSLNWQF